MSYLKTFCIPSNTQPIKKLQIDIQQYGYVTYSFIVFSRYHCAMSFIIRTNDDGNIVNVILSENNVFSSSSYSDTTVTLTLSENWDNFVILGATWDTSALNGVTMTRLYT